MVLADADRVSAAGLLVAHIHAGMRQSVAELIRWAVDVVDARHRSAAQSQVTGIADVGPGWALAFGDVVVDGADGVGAAPHQIACR